MWADLARIVAFLPTMADDAQDSAEELTVVLDVTSLDHDALVHALFLTRSVKALALASRVSHLLRRCAGEAAMLFGEELGYEAFQIDDEDVDDNMRSTPKTAIGDLHRMYLSPGTSRLPFFPIAVGTTWHDEICDLFGHFDPRLCTSKTLLLPGEQSDIPLVPERHEGEGTSLAPGAAEYDNLRTLLCAGMDRCEDRLPCRVTIPGFGDVNDAAGTCVSCMDQPGWFVVEIDGVGSKNFHGSNLLFAAPHPYPEPPSTRQLHQYIEAAWAEGYDPEGYAELGGRLKVPPKKPYIGATEVLIALWHRRVQAFLVEVMDARGAGLAIFRLAYLLFGARRNMPHQARHWFMRCPVLLQQEGYSQLILGVMACARDPALVIADPGDPGSVGTQRVEELTGQCQLVFCGEYLPGLLHKDFLDTIGQSFSDGPHEIQPVLRFDENGQMIVGENFISLRETNAAMRDLYDGLFHG